MSLNCRFLAIAAPVQFECGSPCSSSAGMDSLSLVAYALWTDGIQYYIGGRIRIQKADMLL